MSAAARRLCSRSHSVCRAARAGASLARPSPARKQGLRPGPPGSGTQAEGVPGGGKGRWARPRSRCRVLTRSSPSALLQLRSCASEAGELPYTVDASRKDVKLFICCRALAVDRLPKKAPWAPVPQAADDR